MKNLKAILVMCLLAIGAMGVSAQSTSWGIKAGLNVSSIEGIDVAKYTPGFNVGVFGQFMFTESFGVETGLRYSMLSHKISGGEFGLTEDKTFRSSYIQIPATLIYKFAVGDNLYLYPQAGLYLGYGLGGTDNYFDAAERFDLGVDLGLNLQFDRFIIGAGWERGLLKIWKEHAYSGENDAYNSNVMVNIGYIF